METQIANNSQNINEQLLSDRNSSTRVTMNESEKQVALKKRPKANKPKQTLLRLLKYTFKYKGWLFIANFSMVISSLGMIILPLLCGNIIDHIKQNSSLLTDAIEFLILSIVMSIFSALRGFSFNFLGELIVRDLRGQVFHELLEKDISFYDANKSGQLISRLTSDISVIQGVATDNISILLRNLLQFGGSLIFLWLISWQLSTFIVIVTPVICFIILFMVKKMKILKKQYQSNLAFANSLANEVFGNIRLVKSFSTQNNQHNNYRTLLQNTFLTGSKQAKYYALMLLVTTIFSNFLILSILYFGGKLCQDGELTIGELASYVLYTITLTVGFASVSGIFNQMISALGVCQRIFEIIDEPISILKKPCQLLLPNKNNIQVVKFVEVEFSYPSKPQVKVLNGLNFTILKGQSVAIVGSSGSGKSSIINLILRFYDSSEGTIQYCGCNIKQINLQQLRKQIGIVSQQPNLFSCSLRDNIEYGLENEQKQQSKIINALQIANAKSFALNPAVFPSKLNTLVGERGIKLSGGQKQRIAIARSVIKNPSLLIFDEATSALDAQSQHLVQKAIDKLVGDRQKTTIIVAHRLSTIINCDKIIVLQDGKVVEQGNHEQLLKKKGFYSALIQRQLANMNSNKYNDLQQYQH